MADAVKPDANSNASAKGSGLGPTSPNPAPGVVQTTIDSRTTTIHPNATITNRVEPDGTPHTGQKPDKPLQPNFGGPQASTERVNMPTQREQPVMEVKK